MEKSCEKTYLQNWIQADCRVTYSHQEWRIGYIDRAINHNRMLKKRTLSSSDFLLEVFSQTIPYWDLCTFAGRHTACAPNFESGYSLTSTAMCTSCPLHFPETIYHCFGAAIWMGISQVSLKSYPQRFCKARWGVAEWIERTLLMLEVRGSSPSHSASKNTTSLPRNPRGTH